jgi:hypothetical protein
VHLVQEGPDVRWIYSVCAWYSGGCEHLSGCRLRVRISAPLAICVAGAYRFGFSPEGLLQPMRRIRRCDKIPSYGNPPFPPNILYVFIL